VTPIFFFGALVLLAYQAFPLKGLFALEAFDNLVYARSMALNHGLSYMGLPAQGWSNLVWVSMVYVFSILSGDMLQVAQYLGLICSALTLALLLLWSRDFFDRYWPGALAGLFLAASFPFVLLAGAGTDLPFRSFIFTLALWLFTRDVKCRHYLRSAIAWVLVLATFADGLALAIIPVGIVACSLFTKSPSAGGRAKAVGWLAIVGIVAVLSNSATGGALDGLGTTEGWMLLIHDRVSALPLGFLHLAQHPGEAILPLALLATVTLERGPGRLAPAYLALYCIMGVFVCVQRPAAGTADFGTFVPILPATCFALASGLAMLVYHRPRRFLVGTGYFLLLICIALGILLHGFRPEIERSAIAQEILLSDADSFSMAAEYLLSASDPQTGESRGSEGPVLRVAAFDAAAISYYAGVPILDLRGRHTDSRLVQLEDPARAPEIIHLPLDLGDVPDAPIFLRHPEAAKLYYTEAFQRHYLLSGDQLVPIYRRRNLPLELHLMARYFSSELTGRVRSHFYRGMPCVARFRVRNLGTGSWLNIVSPAKSGYVALRATWIATESGVVSHDELIPLPEPLLPGDVAEFDATLTLPILASRYTLRVTLELVGVQGFLGQGLRPLTFDVEVLPPAGRAARPLQVLEQSYHTPNVDTDAAAPRDERPVVPMTAPLTDTTEVRPSAPLPTPTPLPRLPVADPPIPPRLLDRPTSPVLAN